MPIQRRPPLLTGTQPARRYTFATRPPVSVAAVLATREDDRVEKDRRSSGVRGRQPSRAVVLRRRILAIAGGLGLTVVLALILTGSLGGAGLPAPSVEPSTTGKVATDPEPDLGSGPAGPQQLAAGKVLETADWKPTRAEVPILMYHDVEAPPAEAPFPELHVDARDFADQMSWLAGRGYTAVTIDQVAEAWYRGGSLPAKPIVLTFDDGFASHFDVARPVLADHGWPGVLMLQVMSGKGLPEGGAISPKQVEKLIAGGWEIGSHTITHADLTTIDGTQLESEVARSRDALREQFGIPVNHLCFPAGKYDDTVIAAAEKAGYESASTVEPGLGDRSEPFTLERIRVDGSDGLDGFVGKLEAAGA